MLLLFGKPGVSIQNSEDKERWFRKKSNFLVFRHSGPPAADKLQPESSIFN
jgi:hypothetical protein